MSYIQFAVSAFPAVALVILVAIVLLLIIAIIIAPVRNDEIKANIYLNV